VIPQTNEIAIAILGGSAILIFLGFTLIFLIIIYRRKQKEYFNQKLLLQENFRKELLQAQLETQEQTFHSLSQELHDNIGQLLSLAKLNMSLVEMSSTDNNESITQTKNLLNTAINDLRDISKTLNTEYVKEKDIKESIERELAMLRRTRKFDADFELSGTPFFIKAERRLILYRIIQESLNNIVKHAGATHIHFSMVYLGEVLEIIIRDNGVGFDMKATPNGVGLINIKQRSTLIDSKVNIYSEPGKGTTLSILVSKDADENV
jgi:two-component system NarL family sensor kinase